MTEATIRPRPVRFEWERTPLHWVPGDPFATHLVNVLHLLLPAGEKWFVDVYRDALPLVRDDTLRRQVKGFMGQEAVHARAHASVLGHLRDQGLDAEPYTRRIERMFSLLLGPRRGPRWVRRARLRMQLASIAGIEHLTALLGHWILDCHGLDAAGADPTMLDLLRWHGAEEMEHRAVAFDLYRHVSGSYLRRAAAMAMVLPVLVLLWIEGVRFLMRADPTLSGVRPRWRDYRRAARRTLVPAVHTKVPEVLRYFRRDFHPSQEGSTELALAYLASSPAARAAERLSA